MGAFLLYKNSYFNKACKFVKSYYFRELRNYKLTHD